MADEQETSLRDDILTAAGEEPEVENIEVEEPATTEATEEKETEVQGETGEREEAVAAEPDTPAEPAAPAYKPPVDWSPEVKAKWNELTPEIQAAIHERERGINETLQNTAQIRQEYDDFNKMIAPYQPLMQAEGVTHPAQAIKGLLDTTAALMMGSPQQKAQRIAGLIQHYGVDINTLADVIEGTGGGADPVQAQLNQMLDQRLAPVNELLAQVNQTKQQAQEHAQQQAGQTIEQFAADPKHIHFDAVRDTMADFLDMASARGQNMSIEEAYQRACLSDPQIAPLVTQEFAAQANAGNAQTIAGKRNAASSIHGSPAAAGGTMGLTDDMSLRETIEAQLAGGKRI